jgi:hypothetical protein
LSRNSNCHVTMEMLQTHCYATGTVTLLWKRRQGPNMSQYVPHTLIISNFAFYIMGLLWLSLSV